MGIFDIFTKNKGRTIKESAFIDYINSQDIYATSYLGLEAIRNSDIYTGVNIIAGDIAQSPFKNKTGYTAPEDILYMLNTQPKKNQSHYMMMFGVIANLILTGNAYILIHRDGETVRELEFVPSEQVNIIQDLQTGEYRYDVTMPYGNVMYKALPEDILHFKISSTNGWIGTSPLESLAQEVALQTNGLKVLNNFFAKGVFSGGVLTLKDATLNNSSKKQIRQDFEKVNGAGGTIILDSTQEFTESKINTEVLKLIQANKFSTQQIAKVLGIPVNRFGQELVNSSDEGQNSIYIASTVAMYEASICDEINLKLGVQLELDLTKLMQDSKEDRLRRVAEGKTKSDFAKVFTVNDAREYLGLQPIDEEGDTLIGNLGKAAPTSEVSEGVSELDKIDETDVDDDE